MDEQRVDEVFRGDNVLPNQPPHVGTFTVPPRPRTLLHPRTAHTVRVQHRALLVVIVEFPLRQDRLAQLALAAVAAVKQRHRRHRPPVARRRTRHAERGRHTRRRQKQTRHHCRTRHRFPCSAVVVASETRIQHEVQSLCLERLEYTSSYRSNITSDSSSGQYAPYHKQAHHKRIIIDAAPRHGSSSPPSGPQKRSQTTHRSSC